MRLDENVNGKIAPNAKVVESDRAASAATNNVASRVHENMNTIYEDGLNDATAAEADKLDSVLLPNGVYERVLQD